MTIIHVGQEACLRQEISTPLLGKLGPAVLVVDDDEAICSILKRMLSDEGYQVHLSNSVADAFEAIEDHLFEVYVIDYHLMDGVGLEVAERVRLKGLDAPIIFLSGSEPTFVGSSAGALQIFEIISNALKKAIQFPKGIAA